MKHLQNITLEANTRKGGIENIILIALLVLGGLGMYLLFGANTASGKPSTPSKQAIEHGASPAALSYAPQN